MKRRILSLVSWLFVLNISFLNAGYVDNAMLINGSKREDQREAFAEYKKVYLRNYNRCFHMRNLSSCSIYILVAALFLHGPSSAMTPDGNISIGLEWFPISEHVCFLLATILLGHDGTVRQEAIMYNIVN
jgi:hypothetical protein